MTTNVLGPKGADIMRTLHILSEFGRRPKRAIDEPPAVLDKLVSELTAEEVAELDRALREEMAYIRCQLKFRPDEPVPVEWIDWHLEKELRYPFPSSTAPPRLRLRASDGFSLNGSPLRHRTQHGLGRGAPHACLLSHRAPGRTSRRASAPRPINERDALTIGRYLNSDQSQPGSRLATSPEGHWR